MFFLKNAFRILILILPTLVFPVDVLIEAKAAFFQPTQSRFKKIYSGGGIYGAELSVQAWKELFPWISVDSFSQNGRSIIDDGNIKGNRTQIQFVPVGVGLKYIAKVHTYFDAYFGFGATATYLHLKNYMTNHTHTQTNWGPGFTCKIGTHAYLVDGLCLDLAIDYRYAKVNFSKPLCAAHLNGFSFGGGIGYKF